MRPSELHHRAIAVSRQYLKLESELIEHLIEIDRRRLYKQYEVSSLFVYVTKYWNLSEAVTYAFITVARKASEVPELLAALKSRQLTVAKAHRIASRIEKQNAAELIEAAKTLSSRVLEKKLHREDPDRANQKTLKIPAALLEEIKRIRDFEPGAKGLIETLTKIVHEYGERHDPVKKARRALSRTRFTPKKNNELCASRVGDEISKIPIRTHSRARKLRIPLRAAERHAVMLRDEGRCTFIHRDGTRCKDERFIELHHVRQVQHGGSNSVENLSTLCGFHHDLVHQLSFPLDEARASFNSATRI